MDMIKVAFLAVTGVLLGLCFRSQKQEYGIFIGFGICLLIFTFVLKYLSAAGNQLWQLQNYMQGEKQYFGILFKVIGITYLCEFCASICRDAGFTAVAGQVELFGKITVLLAGLPILLAVIDTISGFLA